MSLYIPPLVQNNSDLKNGKKIRIIIKDIRILRNEKWGSKVGTTLLELVFESTCGRIIVKKVPYSFAYNSDISKIYESATGKVLNMEKGFDSDEIIGKLIVGTISKYEHKGYTGTTVIDFEAVK